MTYKRKASFVEMPKKAHQWKRLGYVVVHDATGTVSFNQFDFRYAGNKSRLGRYLLDLEKQGVDISAVKNLPRTKVGSLELKKEDELVIVLAKRLFAALAKRTIYIDKTAKTKYDESWDWSKPAAKQSKYYQMAERILADNDRDAALRIVNIITGYA